MKELDSIQKIEKDYKKSVVLMIGLTLCVIGLSIFNFLHHHIRAGILFAILSLMTTGLVILFSVVHKKIKKTLEEAHKIYLDFIKELDEINKTNEVQ